jgi:hypothetical protein
LVSVSGDKPTLILQVKRGFKTTPEVRQAAPFMAA